MASNRSLRFVRDGGWVGIAGVVVTAGAVAFQVAPVLHRANRAVGDGRTVASYGFALSPAVVPVERIVAGGLPKDGLPALVAPELWSLDRAHRESAGRSKFLVPTDRVIGVTIGGETRAYPLRLLVWHEVVNDTLGGVPIAVTYSPLCDAAVVFDRRTGNETLTFAVSGLLLNSNLLMYDRRTDGQPESLWSQLLFQSVAGPSAGSALEVRPSVVAPWREWRSLHPATSVLAPVPRLLPQYKRDPYSSYFGSDVLRFPVNPLPPPGGGALKAGVIAFPTGPRRFAAVPLDLVVARAAASREWVVRADGQVISLRLGPERSSVTALGPDGPLPVAYSAYFAWYAMHRDDTDWLTGTP